MPRFTDKTVIITGATGALGSSLVRRFAAEGANVVIAARREQEAAPSSRSSAATEPCFTQLDVSDEQRWAAAVQKAEVALSPVSILVNNAARMIPGTTESLTPDEFREVINTNPSVAPCGSRGPAHNCPDTARRRN